MRCLKGGGMKQKNIPTLEKGKFYFKNNLPSLSHLPQFFTKQTVFISKTEEESTTNPFTPSALLKWKKIIIKQ